MTTLALCGYVSSKIGLGDFVINSVNVLTLEFTLFATDQTEFSTIFLKVNCSIRSIRSQFHLPTLLAIFYGF